LRANRNLTDDVATLGCVEIESEAVAHPRQHGGERLDQRGILDAER
jgi:hypothetical protein